MLYNTIMDYIFLGLAILGGYFLIVFVVLRFVAPFMGFKGYKIPQDVPVEIMNAIFDLENKTTNQQTYLEGVYKLVLYKTNYQWKHTRFQAALRLNKLFVKDLQNIWSTPDFLYCTAINYLGFTMLVKSKYFKIEDIRVKHVFLNFVIHQYLQIKIGENWVDFDPSGAGIRGYNLGSHASFFG